MPHEFCPGYPTPYAGLVAAFPGADVYPAADFRVEWDRSSIADALTAAPGYSSSGKILQPRKISPDAFLLESPANALRD